MDPKEFISNQFFALAYGENDHTTKIEIRHGKDLKNSLFMTEEHFMATSHIYYVKSKGDLQI